MRRRRLAPTAKPRHRHRKRRRPRRHRRRGDPWSICLIVRAKEQLRTLTGYEIDSVSAFTRSDGGWRLSVTVVELHRIPPVTDVLARYDVDLDTEGDVVSYHRGKRYFRDQVGDDT